MATSSSQNINEDSEVKPNTHIASQNPKKIDRNHNFFKCFRAAISSNAVKRDSTDEKKFNRSHSLNENCTTLNEKKKDSASFEKIKFSVTFGGVSEHDKGNRNCNHVDKRPKQLSSDSGISSYSKTHHPDSRKYHDSERTCNKRQLNKVGSHSKVYCSDFKKDSYPGRSHYNKRQSLSDVSDSNSKAYDPNVRRDSYSERTCNYNRRQTNINNSNSKAYCPNVRKDSNSERTQDFNERQSEDIVDETKTLPVKRIVKSHKNINRYGTLYSDSFRDHQKYKSDTDCDNTNNVCTYLDRLAGEKFHATKSEEFQCRREVENFNFKSNSHKFSQKTKSLSNEKVSNRNLKSLSRTISNKNSAICTKDFNDSIDSFAELSNVTPSKLVKIKEETNSVEITVFNDQAVKAFTNGKETEVDNSFDEYISKQNLPSPHLSDSENKPSEFDEHFDSDQGFISPPVPSPSQTEKNSNSSLQTSGYISTGEETNDHQCTNNDNSQEDDYSSISELNHYEEISSFLLAVEKEFCKSSDRAIEAVKDVNRIVKYHYTGDSVQLYGSYLSGLAVNTSNINLALYSYQPAKDAFMCELRKHLYEKLKKTYHVETFEPAASAKQSKIILYHSENAIDCEIAYAGKTVKNYKKMNSLLKDICTYDKRIKTLLIAVRIWAEKCLIHDAEMGRLHTVGYSLMVIYFLQQLKIPVIPIIQVSEENKSLENMKQCNSACAGQLWLEFLEFYSNIFNWEDDVICITKKAKVSKKDKSWERSWIAIEDPFTEKNIGSSIIKASVADYIKTCFSSYYDYFLSPSTDSDSESSNGSNTEDKKVKSPEEKYSFNAKKVLKDNLETCEMCDELGGPCQECLGLEVPSVEKFPEASEECLSSVKKVINEIFGNNLLTAKQIGGRKRFVKDLEKCVQQRFPNANLSLFGSSVNGFGFFSSDLDICMTLGNKDKLKNNQQTLRNLCSLLRRNRNYRNVMGLYRATIPLVKFSSTEMNWKCDISFCNVLAVHNSKLLNVYASFDVRCKKLGCALKLLTKKAGIAECVAKTLSSYSYILMTIHYLQQLEPPVLPVFSINNMEVFENNIFIPDEVYQKNDWLCKTVDELKETYKTICTNTSTVEVLWLGLLEFYLSYDYDRAISIVQKDPLETSELEKAARLFNIQDPFLQKRNLGCYVSERKANEIWKIFKQARLLFGKEKPKSVTDLKNHYFSTMNLTGQYRKDMDCTLCGAYGHDRDQCRKSLKPYKPRGSFYHS